MEKNSCKKCEHFRIISGSRGVEKICKKNGLVVEFENDWTCDMYEEEEKENRAKMRIIKLELVRDGISVTMEDKNIGLSTECVLDIKYSDKLVIGDTMDLIFG